MDPILANDIPGITPPVSGPVTPSVLGQVPLATSLPQQFTGLPDTRSAYMQGYLAEKNRLAQVAKNANKPATQRANTNESEEGSEESLESNNTRGGSNPALIPLLVGLVLGMMNKKDGGEGGAAEKNSAPTDGTDGGTDGGPTGPEDAGEADEPSESDESQDKSPGEKSDLSAAPLSDQEKKELNEGEQAINKFRAENGKPPIKLSVSQCMKAKGWSKRMANGVGLEHSNFGLRENIAMGAGILGTIKMWIDSPGHRANLLGAKGEIGLGKSGTYWTMIDGQDKGDSKDWSNIA